MRNDTTQKLEAQGKGRVGGERDQFCLRAGGGGESFTEQVKQTEFLALVIPPTLSPSAFSAL